jgi:hypothetical protein
MPATKRAASNAPPVGELVPMQAEVETWLNESAGIVVINRLGEYGRQVVDMVNGGRRFQITPAERRMNQNACAQPDQDVFTNGTLRPISLLDSEPDTESLRINPNLIAEEDLASMFQLKGEFFVQRIATITNPAAMNRVVEMARDPRFDATLAQYEAAKQRELDLQGDLTEGPSNIDPASIPRGVTPR